ncbi:MAG TPA: RNA polymerase sigma-70 factor [Thermoleophilaceae bacterium]|jgi:RNA polymerase sigma-70 factor (ECF subfamily)
MAVAISDQELETVRRRAFGVAYRMLGTVSEAEDVAQEAVIRLARAEGAIDEPAAWVTTVATRLSLDVLRSARKRRETYVGPWLPEPLIGDSEPGPAEQTELSDTLSQAFLVILERLTPVERAAYILREVFDYDYARIGEIVDRSEENCRQIVTRARKHIEASRPRFDPDEALRDELLRRFIAAAREGDVEQLEEMLAEDVVAYADGGGKISAARKLLVGRERVAKVMAKIASKTERHGPFDVELVKVNGQPGRIMRMADGTLWDVLTIDVVDGKVQAIRIIRNPDKLRHV